MFPTISRDERGATLVEIAIAATLILVPLAAAVLDLGSALRNTQVLVEAAKQGARVGAQSTSEMPRECCMKKIANPGTCADSAELATLATCTTLLASNPSAVNTIAKKAACQYLRDAGLAPDDWQIDTQFQLTNDPPFVPQDEPALDATTQTQILRVTVQNPPGRRACFICIGGLGRTQADITFAVENKCIEPLS